MYKRKYRLTHNLKCYVEGYTENGHMILSRVPFLPETKVIPKGTVLQVEYKDKEYYEIKYSAIIDSKTCDVWLSMDCSWGLEKAD